jgi:hypothetical protein
VAEKDNVVAGMLQDELSRCNEAIVSMRQSLSKFPKGSLGIRKRSYGNRNYEYHYLKFRDKNKVINQHVPEGKVQELRNKITQRQKIEKEIKVYEKRVSYLKKLLRTKKHSNGI